MAVFPKKHIYRPGCRTPERMMEKRKRNLRVYCLCGQRMKVTPDMYGKPAKCVSCHQKWFIPAREEVPAKVRFIHLQDHPELLRQPGQLARAPCAHLPEEQQLSHADNTPALRLAVGELESADRPESGQAASVGEGNRDLSKSPPAGSEDASLAEPIDSDAPVPTSEDESVAAPGESTGGKIPAPIIKASLKCAIDDFPALRLLCSYQYAVDQWKQAQYAKDSAHPRENHIRQAREALNSLLQAEQAQAELRLATMEKAIVGVNLRLRIGEISPEVFLRQVTEIREQREALVRLLHNLSAWMNMTSPFLAGGLIKILPENFNENSYSLELPVVPVSEQAAASSLGEALRESLRMRAGAERKLAEWRQMAEEGAFPSEVAEEGLSAAKAEYQRALDRIRFFQDRLERLYQDCNHDLKALETFRGEARYRARQGKIEPQALRSIEAEIQQACTDTLRLRNIIKRYLSANATAEVPPIPDTLLQRLRGWHRVSGFQADLIPAILGALAIGAGGVVALNGDWVVPAWMHVMVLMFPFVWVILAALPKGSRRSKALTLYCVLQTALIGMYVARAGVAHLVVLEPAGLFLLLGLFLAAVTAGLSWRENAFFIHWPSSVRTLAILFLSGMSVAPVLAVDIAFQYDLPPAIQEASDDAPLPDLGGESVSTNSEGVVESGVWREDAAPASVNSSISSSPQDTEVPGTLAPSEANTTSPVTETPSPAVEPETLSENEISDPNLSTTPATAMAYFELHGVVHAEGVSPRFRATLHAPNGMAQPLALGLNQVIYGAWKTYEYNVESKKLTLYNGERFLVLQAGDGAHLDDAGTADPL